MGLTYDKEWKRPVMNNWYNELTEIPDTLTGEKYYQCEIVEAKTRLIDKVKLNKANEQYLCRYEILNLVLKVKDQDYHLPAISIFAHTKKDDGEWSSDSVQLHDFLTMALEQKPNALDNSYDYVDAYNNGTVYPELNGVKLICVMAQVGARQTSKGTYPDYHFALFDPKGYTVVEKEEGDKTRSSLKNTMEKLFREYKEYAGLDEPVKEEVSTKEPALTSDDDDLPF